MKKLLLLLCSVAISYIASAQELTATFRFLPDNDTFMAAGNEAELTKLSEFIGRHSEEIKCGDMVSFVTGYSSGMPTEEANLASARERSNQVKSYMITENGMTEDNFTTTNYATSYKEFQSVVIVEFTYVTVAIAPVEEPEIIEEEEVQVIVPEPVVEEVEEEVIIEEPVVFEVVEAEPAPARHEWDDSYCFAVRGNVLYWAGLLPSLGIEWRVSNRIGIKLDGQFSDWTLGKNDDKHNIIMGSPEVRYYMGEQRRFYLGLGGNFGKADFSWKPFTALFDNGCDGNFYGGGLVVGYQARLANRLSLDLNLGLGATYFDYETYTMAAGVRTNTGKTHRTFWGPTQAGVALVWRIGGDK